jgi:hypothetical protein
LSVSETEIAQGLDWRDWGKQFGWQLRGWTFDHVADFYLPSGKLAAVEKEMRQTIDKRIAELTPPSGDAA